MIKLCVLLVTVCLLGEGCSTLEVREVNVNFNLSLLSSDKAP